MKRSCGVVIGLVVLLTLGIGLNFYFVHAAEHAGDRAGSADLSRSEKQFGASEIQSAIKNYIRTDQKLKHGYFYIHDEQMNYDWKLKFTNLHPVRIINRDGKKIYFACTSFTVKNDTDQYSTLDVDFWMSLEQGELEPYKIRIHKVDGEKRFTYENDRPVKK